MAENTIKIERKIDGFHFTGMATYREAADGWDCTVRDGATGPVIESRRPDLVHDAVAELWDMIDLALETARQREALNAGPYSAAQCR